MSSALPYIETNPVSEIKATVIWLHGLGDSGHGFAPIVPELRLPDALGVRFVFPHAPERPVTINGGMRMRAWYDIKSMDFDKRADLTGVRESAEQVEQLIEAEISNGVPPEKIILAGFSQGGVIALHLGPRFSKSLGGIMGLSTYMCQPELLAGEAHPANQQTPVFMAHGEMDDVVPIAMGKAAYDTLTANQYNVSWQSYRMKHNLNMDEINAISQWLQARLA
ncbi:MAG TPA: carboxylesterase [Alteromonas sp.]|jgi:phospholipase/carboxylesterase|nr:carboxylesterase [Alteromonas sp.]HCA77375.1 carboxylesterase [Alteromonas sp.]HCB10032.1 carboxylesterase [Alteromonas sp.]HCB17771.1 carboxylesterase [Alteromonas sp.]HCV18748.1 carboxylesterase [Alteromonas sp.]|tara:strand:- start:939 stop:1607 length:669 start_codon:yes stop_codon:yes gene_type:complete